MTMISEGQVFFSVNEKAVKTCKSLPHEELEGKNTNPNLDVKQKKKKIKYHKNWKLWHIKKC